MTYEEFRDLFEDYVNRPNNCYTHPFREYAACCYFLANYPNDSQWAIEHRHGLNFDQVCKILYSISILGIPLDRVYNKLAIGDTVVTYQGLIGTIIDITPSKYLKIIIKGSDRQVRRYCLDVTKINHNFDILNTI